MIPSEKKIVKWLKSQLVKSRAKGFICGLSGGIDSAVAAALIKKAAGKKHLCLILPCSSSAKDLKDAAAVARKFKLKTKAVHLCSIYDGLLKVLPAANRLAKANLKARLRMMTLYYFANNLNYMVVGTGNKSELMQGYYTKFGDGGVDLLPLGNILKTDVRKLAVRLGVPAAVLTKPPSAGLWKGQTDEGEMGITYAMLDDILRALAGGKRPKASKAQINKVKAKIRRSEHKRKIAEVFK